MAIYLTNTEDLTTVANAIRTKGETSEQLSFPNGFAQAIADISSKEEQTKSVTITTNGSTTVTPDTNKTLSSVNITTNVPASLSFTQTSIPTTNSNWTCTYGKGKYVALCMRKCLYSTDGINWSIKDTDIKPGQILYANGVFVAVDGWNTTKSFYSTDGINWNEATVPTISSPRGCSVHYFKGMFLMYRGSNIISKSADGINWTQQSLDVATVVSGISVTDNKVMAISASGELYTSESGDAGTWTLLKRTGENGYFSWSGNGVVCTSLLYGKLIVKTSDGVNSEEMYYDNSASATPMYINGIYYLYKTVNGTKYVKTSLTGNRSDFTDWREVQNFYGDAFTYGGGRLIGVGPNNGSICDMRIPIT